MCDFCHKKRCYGQCIGARNEQRQRARNKMLGKTEEVVEAQEESTDWTSSFGHITLTPGAGIAPGSLITWTIVGTNGAPRDPLPEREQLDPFVGYKTLKIVAHGGRLLLKGIAGNPYQVDSTALCFAGALSGLTMIGIGPDSGKQVKTVQPTHSHLSPERDCTCGFYGLQAKPAEWEYGAFRAQVEFFGRVIHGTLGWRAERQRVLSLEARRTCAICVGKAVGFSTSADGQVIPICREHAVLGCASPADLTEKIGTQVSWVA